MIAYSCYHSSPRYYCYQQLLLCLQIGSYTLRTDDHDYWTYVSLTFLHVFRLALQIWHWIMCSLNKWVSSSAWLEKADGHLSQQTSWFFLCSLSWFKSSYFSWQSSHSNLLWSELMWLWRSSRVFVTKLQFAHLCEWSDSICCSSELKVRNIRSELMI